MEHFTDALFEDFNLIENIAYKDISDLEHYKKSAKEIPIPSQSILIVTMPGFWLFSFKTL